MPGNLCKILLIEENCDRIKLIERLLLESEGSSLAEGLFFTLTFAKTLSQGIECLAKEIFDVILLNLMLPDSKGINSLIALRDRYPKVPIILQTESEDETLVVKAFQLGADGYLHTKTLDRNFLVYEIRLAIERQEYLAKLERLQQQKEQELEFQQLERRANSTKTSITARMFGSETLRESIPDIFEELAQTYGKLLDLALEERAYKVEHNISDRLRALADKLGFLKASPRDVVDIHTKTLREKNQGVPLAKAQAYVAEGRLMVLELMGYLTSFYRKYYIGLSNIKFSPQLEQENES
ncbi:MAG: response regulator transcription factor [Hydrococcus sp. C42_A2020_068]|nr:response regulator transcription factor [Hydrococcus sp. C42_A2020_068]